jgi:hypothetical protein
MEGEGKEIWGGISGAILRSLLLLLNLLMFIM